MEKQQIDCEAIRRAVIKYADSIGRPHFDVVVVREVVNSFIYDTPHHLKDAVKQYIGETQTNAKWSDLPTSEKRCRLLAQFCDRFGMPHILAKKSGLSRTYLTDMKNGKRDISDAIWKKLLDAFDDCEKEYKQKRGQQLVHINRKLNACGVKK